MLILLSIILSVLYFPVGTWAACGGSSPNWTAVDTSYAEVKDCIDGASSGDTINIPSGASTWDGTSNIVIDKTLTIVGAGIDSTIITDNSTASSLLDIRMGNDEMLDMSNLTFSGGSKQSHTMGMLFFNYSYCTAQDKNKFRIHSVKFHDMNAYAIRLYYLYGLIDNCIFDTWSAGKSCIFVNGDGVSSASRSITTGTANSLFVESNQFDNALGGSYQGAAILEMWDGARAVLRYNCSAEDPCTNVHISSHGWTDVVCGAAGNYFSCAPGDEPREFREPVLIEIYNNFFECTDTVNDCGSLTMRGGQWIVHDNVWTENPGANFISGLYLYYLPFIDSDNSSCFDCTHCARNRPTEYPAYGQPGYVGSTAYPIYIWDNTLPSAGITLTGDGNNTDGYDCTTTPKVYNVNGQCETGENQATCFIRENRDYYLSSKDGYTAYTYPHPLRNVNTGPNSLKGRSTATLGGSFK